MGLDMYLYKKTYIGAYYDHRNIDGKITLRKNGKPINIQVKRVSEITERVGQWRKANAIHNWFVTNVQDGEDDCSLYEVDEEKIQWFLAICERVKENHALADELLPTVSGDFFGETDYNEDYFQDIEDTIKILKTCLEEDGNYAYQSSW